MFIKDVAFLKSVSINDNKVFFDEKDEIVFVGRSNVWKSSLMNALFQKKDLVKTSSKPWKTRTANLFVVNKKYYYTDLPWYGFAKLGKLLREHLDSLISWYLEERKQYIKQVVILIDAKLWAQEIDIENYKYILELELPVTVVLSKADKLSKNDVAKSINKAKNDFFGQTIFAVSSTKKHWLDELDKHLRKSLIK